MRTLGNALLILGAIVFALLALENLLIVLLMLETGVPRAVWISLSEFAIFASLSIILITRLRSLRQAS